jgi:hypothetical protein
MDSEQKTYYELNREEILNKLRTPIHCEICDITMLRSSILPHTKTKKHLNNSLRAINGYGPIKKKVVDYMYKPRRVKDRYLCEIINEPAIINFALD